MKYDNDMNDLWAVTVNWNQSDFTQQCINDLRSNGLKDSNIIVVDNGSTDNSVEALEDTFPDIKIILSEKNLGFAGGYNLGIQYALSKGAEYILIINNDTKTEIGSLKQLINSTKKYNADITSPIIYFASQPDKIWSAGGYINPLLSAPINAHRRNKHLPRSPINRDFLTGCALLIKRTVFEKIGYFAEEYFLYYEDLDFLMRAKKAEFRAMLIPDSRIYHYVSASSQNSNSEKVYYWMGRSIWQYFRKHAKFWQWIFILPWQFIHLVKTVINLVVRKEYSKVRSFLLGFFWINKTKYGKLYSK